MSDSCQLVLLPSGRRGQVSRGSTLLEAARSLGVELESICGGRQTCGKCQVIVEQGNFPKHGVTSDASHLTPVEPAEGACATEFGVRDRRLACAAEILGDLVLTIPEEAQARKQIVAKAATDRAIDVKPAVRQMYVVVDRPSLEQGRSEATRLCQSMAEEWGVECRIEHPHVLSELQQSLKAGDGAVTVSVWNEREVLRVQPGYAEGAYGLAIDIGSTTVVTHLCDLRTGEVRATESSMNPQVRYGEDLMSRVSYGMTEPQGVERMHRAIVRTLNDLVEQAVARAGASRDDILDAVVVGNPVMHHLFLGIDPQGLGAAPFALTVSTALDLRAADVGLRLHPAARLHLLPCIAGHVGADHVAVLLAEAPQDDDRLSLVIDVGTNAELSLGNRKGLVCASSPTGPAFEGAQISHGQRAAPGAVERVRIDRQTLEPSIRLIGHEAWLGAKTDGNGPKATGICGSGIIECLAEMRLAGIVRADGHFDETLMGRASRLRRTEGGRTFEYVLVDAEQTVSGRAIVVTQNDVRAIQLAKAALYAGAKLLMQSQGVDKVERIILAGAFGSYIDPLHAMVLGLIPDCELESVHAVGNAAGDGARIALLNRDQRIEATRIAAGVEHLQTATAPTFQDEFVAALAIPHASDAFPHLKEILPLVQQEAIHPRHRGRRSRREETRKA
jgi:uncharacterized 2Fe-2S/4Fe-4S cluster protein (DUF4445 family)